MCTFIVKLEVHEKDFVAKKEMKWKLEQIIMPSVLLTGICGLQHTSLSSLCK